ncbi:hypothetical protein KKA14_02610 [bacterium]|nr:hypothetical protein [bacterium]
MITETQNVGIWINPKHGLPEYGQLIVVKWKFGSPKEYDCWVYTEDDAADFDMAVAWMVIAKA